MSPEETTKITVCPVSQLPPGEMILVEHEGEPIAAVHCDGTYFALEERCAHDDGPLVEGELNQADCNLEGPRHG